MAQRHPAATGERLIRRYDNRKLYDPQTRSYVTLDELARLIAAGQDVRVVDQRSGEDLTTLVLTQVILEGIKQRSADVPRQVLTRLIRLGSGAAKTADEAVGDRARRAKEEAERIVSGLLQRGRLPLEEALALRQEIARSLSNTVTQTQRSLETRFHELLEWTERERGLSPAIQSLKERLLTLEAYLGGAAAASPKRSATRRRKRT